MVTIPLDTTAAPWHRGAMTTPTQQLRGDKVRTTLHLPSDLLKDLKHRAVDDGGTMSALAQRYIEEGLERDAERGR